MILGVVLGFPIKVVLCCLLSVIPIEDYLDKVAELTNQAIDDYVDQNPL